MYLLWAREGTRRNRRQGDEKNRPGRLVQEEVRSVKQVVPFRSQSRGWERALLQKDAHDPDDMGGIYLPWFVPHPMI